MIPLSGKEIIGWLRSGSESLQRKSSTAKKMLSGLEQNLNRLEACESGFAFKNNDLEPVLQSKPRYTTLIVFGAFAVFQRDRQLSNIA